MSSEAAGYYIPDEDEPSVFGSCVTVTHKSGSGHFNEDLWTWPKWRKEKRWRQHYENWRAKNPDAPNTHCPPYFGSDTSTSEGLKLIVRLREELQVPGYPIFEQQPTMFIGDTRQISLRWVVQYARDNNMSPDSAVLVAEHERDLGGLTLFDQDQWRDYWWKQIMQLPGIGYPIYRYKEGREVVADSYLLVPGPTSETIAIGKVEGACRDIFNTLVVINKAGGEIVGKFTGYEGFDRGQLKLLLNSFWAGF